MTSSEGEFDFDFNEEGLRGKVLLLPGGCGGLGAAVADRLARDGAALVLGYRRNRERAERLAEHLQKRHQATVDLVEGDLRHEQVREGFIRAASGLPGRLYGLVCLTGDPARLPFAEATPEALQEAWEVNYLAPLLMARSFAAALPERDRDAVIVFFSTMQAVAVFSGSLAYAVPKNALIHAARILAREWGGNRGIRVNVVAPGVNRAGMALASIASGKYDPFVESGVIPRFGRAEDVAKAVRYLVEPDNYVTGQLLVVDGGLTLRRDLLGK
ncbi:MAG: 3-oxoacyl-ACP reductase FabG [Acidobacteriota bacterium]